MWSSANYDDEMFLDDYLDCNYSKLFKLTVLLYLNPYKISPTKLISFWIKMSRSDQESELSSET